MRKSRLASLAGVGAAMCVVAAPAVQAQIDSATNERGGSVSAARPAAMPSIADPASNGYLNESQVAEAQARVAGARAIVARLAANPEVKSLPAGWKVEAMNGLLSMRSAELKAVLNDGRWTGYAAMRGAAKAARDGVTPKVLGDLGNDLVYYPITPCRNADTRVAGGPITGGTARAFNANLSTTQGGTPGCYVVSPNDASAWALNITVVNMNNLGFVAVRSVGSTNLTSTVNYTGAGEQPNNFVIVFNNRSSGTEWEVYAATTVDVIIDLFGYFRPPAATQLQCVIASSAVTAVPVNFWTNIDASCPAGYAATGGGYNTSEGTLGYPGVWVTSLPVSATTWRTWVDNQTNGARNMQTWVQCCRVPGW